VGGGGRRAPVDRLGVREREACARPRPSLPQLLYSVLYSVLRSVLCSGGRAGTVHGDDLVARLENATVRGPSRDKLVYDEDVPRRVGPHDAA
jgi:hypothetical protein